MDKMICGHERDVLRQACSIIIEDLVTGCSALTADSGCKTCMAILDLNDPAKLAEMLAARGREIGLAFWHGPNEPREPSPTDYVLYVIDGVIRLYSPLSPKTWQRHYTITQARAILLQWLRLPDGAHGEASRALRGEP